MSEQVHYKGRIRPVERLYKETLEEQCQRICVLNGHDNAESYYDSWEEVLRYDLYKKYVIINDSLYVIESKKRVTDFDVYIAHQNEDGSIDYEVCFYNGGQDLEDALQEAIDKMS